MNTQILKTALEESVKLQSHYADLLNMYDGGNRMQFESSDEWIDRLKKTGTIKENPLNCKHFKNCLDRGDGSWRREGCHEACADYEVD